MATRFELVLHGPDRVALQSAGEMAIREIERIGKRFSFYDPASELSRLNRQAFKREMVVAGDFFELLLLCDGLFKSTNGFFDPTIGPLMKLWLAGAEKKKAPTPAAIQKAIAITGWNGVCLDARNYSVHFLNEGLQIDLGGIAKGWAIDEAVQLLVEAGVSKALVHGGTSSVRAIGTLDDQKHWTVGIQDPYHRQGDAQWFSTVELNDRALSVSAVNGKSFVDQNLEYGHIINPKSGLAKTGPYVAWVTGSTAVTCDAWSTALLAGFQKSAKTNPEMGLDPRLYAAYVAHKRNFSWDIETLL